MKTVILASLFISLTSAALGQDLAITHATVYASPEASARRDVTVVIRHGVITSVGEHIRQPQGIETLNCPSCIVLAGFWNSHVHFREP